MFINNGGLRNPIRTNPGSNKTIWIIVIVALILLVCCCCSISSSVGYYFYSREDTVESFRTVQPNKQKKYKKREQNAYRNNAKINY